ncbi:MAG: hypothetical protein IH849_02075 [Acidobacteria bacterium]|nr:hypothetical protein [Acidobacteriota bacterium]
MKRNLKGGNVSVYDDADDGVRAFACLAELSAMSVELAADVRELLDHHRGLTIANGHWDERPTATSNGRLSFKPSEVLLSLLATLRARHPEAYRLTHFARHPLSP